MTLPAKPHSSDFEYMQRNGNAVSEAIGSTATTFTLNGTRVLAVRQTGWTAFTGGSSHKGGINGTGLMGSAVTTSADTLSTSVLVVGTMTTTLNKWAFGVDAALRAHGIID